MKAGRRWEKQAGGLELISQAFRHAASDVACLAHQSARTVSPCCP